MNNAEYVYDTLKDDYELNDDNVTSVRWALSFADKYAEYVRGQSRIVIESIQLGQSTLSLGELMRPLFNATHKLTTHDVELDLPGATHFVAATKVAFDALMHIKQIGELTEEYATCALSCDSTRDASYI